MKGKWKKNNINMFLLIIKSRNLCHILDVCCIFEPYFSRKSIFNRIFFLTSVLDKKLLGFVFGLTFLGNQLLVKDDVNELRLNVLWAQMTD